MEFPEGILGKVLHYPTAIRALWHNVGVNPVIEIPYKVIVQFILLFLFYGLVIGFVVGKF